MKCEICYFSENIDGTLFCNYLEEDVQMDDNCGNFINIYRLKDVFENIREFLKLNNLYGEQ